MKKFKLVFTIIMKCGLVYMLLEVIFSAVTGFFIKDVPLDDVSFWSLWGRTSLWMLILGGLMGLVVGSLNETKYKPPVVAQAFMAGIIITVSEFLFGMIFNVGLGLNVWTYEGVPYSLLNQISLPSSIMWFLLAPFGIWLEDRIRYIHALENGECTPHKRRTLLKTYSVFFTLKGIVH